MPPDSHDGGSGHHIWSRRNLLGILGWGAILNCFAASGAAFTRFMYPRVLFEPLTSFKAGFPQDYSIGEVSTKFIPDQRVWIVREQDHFVAILAICTHLGCTPRWLGPENKFKCPCHGSGFFRDGTNFEGPAPRPLEHVKVEMGDDGQLVIDKAVKFRKELSEWDKPGAKLKFTA